jgi:hypothetical protein
MARPEVALEAGQRPAIDLLRRRVPAETMQQRGVGGAIEPGDDGVGPMPAGPQPDRAPRQWLPEPVPPPRVFETPEVVIDVGQLEIRIARMPTDDREGPEVAPPRGGELTGRLPQDAELVQDGGPLDGAPGRDAEQRVEVTSRCSVGTTISLRRRLLQPAVEIGNADQRRTRL